MRNKQYYYLLIFAVLLILVGCGKDDNNAANNQNNDTDSGTDSDVPTVTQVTDAGQVCGNVTCEADLAAAKAAFIAGNYTEAFNQYKCGNTVEAAAGAAVTKLINIAEGDHVTQLLADWGEDTPFSAADIFGPNGLLHQLGTYQDGTGSLEFTTGIEESFETNLQIAYQGDDDGPSFIGSSGDIEIGVVDGDVDTDVDELPTELLPTIQIDGETNNRDLDPDLWIEIQPAIELQAGDTISVAYDCEAGYFEADPLINDLYIDISAYNDGDSTYCWIYSDASLPAGECPSEPGAIEVTQIGDVGDVIEFTFSNIPLKCSNDNDDSYVTYFSGTTSANLRQNDDIDTAGMHPFLNYEDDFIDNISPSLTINQLIAHAAPLADEFEEAACYAEKADNGTRGAVWILPREITGRTGIPLTTRDTHLMAAVLYGAASAIRIATSYDVPLGIGAMLDMNDTELAAEINSNIGALKAENQMTEAKALMVSAVENLLAAIASKEDLGMFPSNSYTAKSENIMNEYVVFVQNSLTDGLTPFPNTTPAINVDLAAFFANPPNPAEISADPVVVEVDTEWDETNIEGVEVFFQEALTDIIPGFSYDMEDYEYDEDDELDELESFGDEIFYTFTEYFGF